MYGPLEPGAGPPGPPHYNFHAKHLFFHAKLLQQHFWDPLHQNLCIADLLSKNSSTMMACSTLSAARYAIA
jgi:hypothetical protein